MWWKLKAGFRCAPFTARQRERCCEGRHRVNNPTESCQAWEGKGGGREAVTEAPTRLRTRQKLTFDSEMSITHSKSAFTSTLSGHSCPVLAKGSNSSNNALIDIFTLVRGVASRCATHLARSSQARYCTGNLRIPTGTLNAVAKLKKQSTRTSVVRRQNIWSETVLK